MNYVIISTLSLWHRWCHVNYTWVYGCCITALLIQSSPLNPISLCQLGWICPVPCEGCSDWGFPGLCWGFTSGLLGSQQEQQVLLCIKVFRHCSPSRGVSGGWELQLEGIHTTIYTCLSATGLFSLHNFSSSDHESGDVHWLFTLSFPWRISTISGHIIPT